MLKKRGLPGDYVAYTPMGSSLATRMTMVVNLVAIHLISGVLTRVFWSAYNPNAPIGG